MRKEATPGMLGLALTLVLVGIWIYAIMDIVTTPAEDVQLLPKLLWLLLVIFFMALAAIAWLLLGRPRRTYVGGTYESMADGRPSHGRPEWGAGGSSPDAFSLRPPQIRARRSRPAPLPPDDDPEFLRELSDRIRRGQNDDPPRS
jgi:hypothetical protein